MEWKEQAIILGVKKHGETSAIVEVMTREHGRHLGVLRGGCSRRYAAMLQPGNRVVAEWFARLDEHIGTFKLEAIDFFAAKIMTDPQALYALQLVAMHLRLLPERDPHPAIFDILALFLEHLNEPFLRAEILVRFEVLLLEELGFGLDLSMCVATGVRENLIYVSPKSARAVCKEAGKPWHDKLLALPAFLTQEAGRPKDYNQIKSGFLLTGYFLERHVWNVRGIEPPLMRTSFIKGIEYAEL